MYYSSSWLCKKMSVPFTEINYFPSVKPSAIVVGLAFNHISNMLGCHPIFGSAFKKAESSDTKEEFIKSKEAAGAAVAYGSTLFGSGIQSYSIAALLKAAGVSSYKEASYVGGLVFAVTSLPVLGSNLLIEKRQPDIVLIRAISSLLDTVGVALALTWWGVDA